MMKKASDTIARLGGRTLVTAESLTGGGIGAALTAVPGASAVFKGGIISYTDGVKQEMLGVPEQVLLRCGAVSAEAARYMAVGVRHRLQADVAVAVTGLAGPDGDAFGNPVGTVFIGYADEKTVTVGEYHFSGDREAVRDQTICAALALVLEHLS